MDWTYKHFRLETVFPAPPEAVRAAALAFLTNSLPDWLVEPTTDGAEMRGLSGLHRAIALFRIERVEKGTRVGVHLRVQRYSIWGYTLWDVGGYYDGQIRKWLRGIQWHLYQSLIAGAQPPGPRDAALDEWQSDWGLRKVPPTERAVKLLMAWWLIGLFTYFVVFPAIGLASGTLLLSGETVLHGAAARTTAAALLLIAGYTGWSTRRGSTGRGKAAKPATSLAAER